MTIYRGYTEGSATAPNLVLVYATPGVLYRLPHLVRHSPNGFSWGHIGAGPADLARSLLGDYLRDEPCPMLYQRFKIEIIAKWDASHDWRLEREEIDKWLKRHPDLWRQQQSQWPRHNK